MRRKILQTAAMMAIVGYLPSLGCSRKTSAETEEKPAAPPFQRNEASLAGMVKQERSKIQNDFKNLAIYYRLCADDRAGKGPAKWEDLKPYIGNDLPSLVKGIEEGRYVIVWKSPMGSKDIIAYEKQADVRGIHIVLHGDGSIVSTSAEDLKKEIKGNN
jgi:hypothetical protein